MYLSQKLNKSILFIESLFENIRKLKIDIYALHAKINKSNCESKPDISSNYSRQPIQIAIATFSGHYLHWERFKDLFTNVIHNNKSCTDFEKLALLNTKLEGKPLNFTSGFIKSDQYNEDWEVLCIKYNSQKSIISALSDELFGITPIKSTSSAHFKEFRGNVDTLITRPKTFDIEFVNMESIFVRFFSRKLDKESYLALKNYVEDCIVYCRHLQ